MSRLVDLATKAVSRESTRRNFLTKLAMVSTAMVVAPFDYLLKPMTAHAAVCGPAPGCNDGYSAFCCTVNRGINNCPPGHIVGGWWRAAGSSYCGQASRYYIDCHPRCNCTTGCGNFCTSNCYACNCECPDTATCDKRHTCCAVFRYGQCNTEFGCIGPVTCRVVTCTPPYQIYSSCGSTLRSDDFTAEQTAPCLEFSS